LESLPKVQWKSSEAGLAKIYEAEARFLRAYYYFDLVRLFGNITLVDNVIAEVTNKQAPASEVYSLIANDLKFAIENLPSVAYKQISPDNYGRVTKWSAEALMARVFLFYTGYYKKSDIEGIVTLADARGYIDDVVNNSGYDLVPTYAGLWPQQFLKFVGEDNIETVFAIKFTYKGFGQKDGCSWNVMVGPRTAGYLGYHYGWGIATVNPALWNAFDEADTRRDVSIISWDKEGIEFNQSDQREYTGFNWRKYINLFDGEGVVTFAELGADFKTDSYNDVVIIRFADVLLMAAELHIDDNPSLAQTCLDRVRDRAFGNDQHRVTANKQNIMDERRFELSLESLRYWDLLRQGLDVAKAALDCTEPYAVSFRPETGGFLSIPQTQIDLSKGLLVQNPGWE
jgi:starch-binding outer membrane protein, SusD/RagB family